MNWNRWPISTISCYHVTSHFILSKAIFPSMSLNPPSSCLLTCVSRVSFFMHPLFGFLRFIRNFENFNRKCLKWIIGLMPFRSQLFSTKTLSICYHLIFNDVLLSTKCYMVLQSCRFLRISFLRWPPAGSPQSSAQVKQQRSGRPADREVFLSRRREIRQRVGPSWCRHLRSPRVFQENSQGTSFGENCVNFWSTELLFMVFEADVFKLSILTLYFEFLFSP